MHILSKYLFQIYGEEQAKQLLLDNSTNLFDYHGLAWSLGKRSLEFFCMFFLQDAFTGVGKAELSANHKEIWDELGEKITSGKHERLEYIISRGFGKTSCITIPVAIWSNLYNYSIYTVISSSVGATAESIIFEIKTLIQDNPYIEAAFGKLFNKRLKNNTEELELDTRPKLTMFRSFSANGTFRGTRYGKNRINLLILDDYQNESVLMSDQTREKFISRFFADAGQALEKSNFFVIAVGTLQRQRDFYDTLSNNPVWLTKIMKGVLVDNIDELFNTGLWKDFKSILTDRNRDYPLEDAKEFYYAHEDQMQYPLLWSEYWDCLDFAINYYQSPTSFKVEIQQDIKSIGECLFKTIVTQPASEIEQHTFIKSLLSIDPAGTARTGSKRDYYAFCVLSSTDSGIKYARKSLVKDFEFDDYMRQTLDILKVYPDITHISIEKQVYSGSDVIRLQELIAKDPELKSRDLTFINKARTGNKDNRINAFAVPDVNMGRVIFNEEDTEAIEQLQEFCGCKYSLHDDFPDCLADALEQINQINTVSKMKVLPLSFLGL